MPRSRLVWLVAALSAPFLLACGKDASSSTISSAPPLTSAAAPAAKPEGFTLAGTLASAPIEFRAAVVAKHPGSEVLDVLVSTHPRACKDLAGGYSLAEGETTFRISVAPELAPKRAGKWFVADTYFAAVSRLGRLRDIDVTVDGSDTAKPVAISLSALTLEGFEKQKLAVHGTIVARGCGVVEDGTTGPGAPGAPKPQPKLTFQVGGTKLDVVGARFEPKSKLVVLSTRPLSCKTSYSYADAALLLQADGSSANLQGLRIGEYFGSTPKPKPKIRLGTRRGQTITADLSGAFTHDGDWPVTVAGTATLDVCDDQ